MILSASKQLQIYRRTFSKLTALVRKHPDAKLSEVIKVTFNELTGVTALELKEPVAHEAETARMQRLKAARLQDAGEQVTGDVPTVPSSHQEV
jgi:hypothetical protein